MFRPCWLVWLPIVALASDIRATEITAWEPSIIETKLQHAPQAPTLTVQRAFGRSGWDTAYDMCVLPGGGFVVVGSTENVERGDHDVLVLRLDGNGEPLWSKRLGGDDLDIGFAVRALPDGSIVIAGWTKSFGAGAGDFYLVCLQEDGTLRFARTFGSPSEERAVSLAVTRSGELAVLGESYGTEAGDAAFYFVVTDSSGNVLWERRYDAGPLNERGIFVVELEDGYLLVGNSMDTTSGSTAVVSDGFAVRTDTAGHVLWSRRYGAAEHDILHSAVSLARDRHLLTGYTRSFEPQGINDVWALLIDDTSMVVGQNLIGGEGADHNIGARLDPCGGAYLAGYSRRQSDHGWDAQIIRVNASGAPEWSHVYGGAGDHGAVVAIPVAGNRLAFTGFTDRGGDRDVLFGIVEMPSE